MLSLYGFKTFLFIAFGNSDFESHQTTLTESFTLILLTVTHSAGVGSLDGL